MSSCRLHQACQSQRSWATFRRAPLALAASTMLERESFGSHDMNPFLVDAEGLHPNTAAATDPCGRGSRALVEEAEPTRVVMALAQRGPDSRR
jgi:hypothetical protein